MHNAVMMEATQEVTKQDDQELDQLLQKLYKMQETVGVNSNARPNAINDKRIRKKNEHNARLEESDPSNADAPTVKSNIRMRKQRQYQWLIYLLLLFLRFYSALQPGYIHPDEFFQGGQELFFGCGGGRPSFNSPPQEKGEFPIFATETNTKRIDLYSQYDLSPTEHENLDCIGVEERMIITATWEYQAENALRSVIPPTIMTLLPLKVYSYGKFYIDGLDTITMASDVFNECKHSVLVTDGEKRMSWMDFVAGWEILIIPRLFMAACSIIALDLPIWYIATQRDRFYAQENEGWLAGDHTEGKNYMPLPPSIPVEVLVNASSWVSLTFLSRPFSNSLETMCLATLCMVAVYDLRRNAKGCTKRTFSCTKWILVPFFMGAIGALGLFTRFTFTIYALPVVLTILYQRFKESDAECSTDLRLRRIRSLATTILCIAVPFLIVSAYFVKHDVEFYVSQTSQKEHESELLENVMKYLTPWNAFRYNSKVGNLSEHGLHPRVTHSLVNFPMLYGPLAIAFYLSSFVGNKYDSSIGGGTVNQIDNMLRGVIVFGLMMLSLAPHQEPRFLLPLLSPIVLLHARSLVCSKWKRFLIFFWTIFNFLLLLFFGRLHQGAVIPSLLNVPDLVTKLDQQQNAIIYFHTYMPPTFLMRAEVIGRHARVGTIIENNLKNALSLRSKDAKNEKACQITDRKKANVCNTLPVVDLQGANEIYLLEKISQYLSCAEDSEGYVNLVAPRPTVGNVCGRYYKCEEIWSSFQIATEDIPSEPSITNFVVESKLSLLKVSCL